MDNQVQPLQEQPEQPIQPQIPSSNGYYKKGAWKKWILMYVIIGLLVYGGIYYFVLSKNKTNPYTYNSTQYPTQSIQNPSPTTDPTANWKTLDNPLTKEYAYSVKYPPDLYPNNGDRFYINASDAQECNYNFDPNYQKSQQFGPNCDKQNTLQILVKSGGPAGFHEIMKKGTKDELIKDLFKNTEVKQYKDTENNSWVVIEDFAQNSDITSMSAEVVTSTNIYSILIQSPKKELKTYLGIASDTDFMQKRNDFFYKILSTFKLTK